MTSIEPDASAPPPPPPPAPPEAAAPPNQNRDKIVGGVAGLIGNRLGVDPLWLRLGFVVLTLASGVGLLIYFALWLILVVGRSPGLGGLRVLGGLLLIVGLPLTQDAIGLPDLAHGHRLSSVAGPLTLVLLLVGMAISLWKQPATSKPSPDPARADVYEARRAVERAEPALLGRATLGLATTVAAVGALIDLANGGRIHPEQWLGAAAVLCGAGLAVGVLRGSARWLIVPALCFAGAGFVSGVVTRVGAPAAEFGDRSIYVYPGDSARIHEAGVTVGDVSISIDGEPLSSSTVIDARVGFGDVYVWTNADVSVDVDVRTDHGTVTLDGVRQADDVVVHAGAESAADVVVHGRVGYGDVIISTYSNRDGPGVYPSSATTILAPFPSAPPTSPQPVSVADGVAITADGLIVLNNGEAIIDTDDNVIAGSSFDGGDGRTYIDTSSGQFTLLPHSLLLGPSGQLLDLAALRASNVADEASAATDQAVTTSTIVAQATVPVATVPTATAVTAATTVPALTTTTLIGG